MYIHGNGSQIEELQYMTKVTYVVLPTSAAQGNRNLWKFCRNKTLSPRIAAYTVVCGNSKNTDKMAVSALRYRYNKTYFQ